MICPECNGSGKVEAQNFGMYEFVFQECPSCGGTGDSENPARIHKPGKRDCDCTDCQYHAEERARGN